MNKPLGVYVELSQEMYFTPVIQSDDFIALLLTISHGFFEKHMLAGPERIQCGLHIILYMGDHCHYIYILIGEHITIVRIGLRHIVFLCDFF